MKYKDIHLYIPKYIVKQFPLLRDVHKKKNNLMNSINTRDIAQ